MAEIWGKLLCEILEAYAVDAVLSVDEEDIQFFCLKNIGFFRWPQR